MYLSFLMCSLGVALTTLFPFEPSLPPHSELAHSVFSSIWAAEKTVIAALLERLPFIIIGALAVNLPAFRRTTLAKFMLVGFSLIVLLESAQLFASGRHARWIDLFIACGFFWGGLRLGFVLRARLRLEHYKAASVFVLALISASIGILVWRGEMLKSLSVWDCDYEISIGNEHGLERQWLGKIRSVELSNRETQNALISMGDNGKSLQIDAGMRFVPSSLPPEFCETIKTKRRVEVTIDLKRSGEVLSGPARILTWSKSIYDQNLMIGEAYERFHLRVRTGSQHLSSVTEIRSKKPIPATEFTHLNASLDNGRLLMTANGRVLAEGSTTNVKFNNGFSLPRRIVLLMLILIAAPLLYDLRPADPGKRR